VGELKQFDHKAILRHYPGSACGIPLASADSFEPHVSHLRPNKGFPTCCCDAEQNRSWFNDLFSWNAFFLFWFKNSFCYVLFTYITMVFGFLYEFKSSQATFIFMALFTIRVVSKQL